MIASMTGYSARVRDIGRGALHLELKSVNSRFLDLFFRLGDEVRVTVIAAGFDGGTPNRREDGRALGSIQSRTTSPAPTSATQGGSSLNTAPATRPDAADNATHTEAPSASRRGRDARLRRTLMSALPIATNHYFDTHFDRPGVKLLPNEFYTKIGRASCRERVSSPV